MKSSSRLLCAAALAIGFAFFSAAPVFAQDTGDKPGAAEEAKVDYTKMYNQARTAFYRGDYATSQRLFEAVRRAYPQHMETRSFLAQIRELTRTDPETALKKQAEKTIIPTVRFSGATVAEAVEYLRVKSAEVTKEQFKPNFVLSGLGDTENKAEITLNLNSVPLSEVLKYVGSMSGVEFRYEKFAIIGKPKSAPAPAVAGDDGKNE